MRVDMNKGTKDRPADVRREAERAIGDWLHSTKVPRVELNDRA